LDLPAWVETAQRLGYDVPLILELLPPVEAAILNALNEKRG
jgi:hypothetical protein